MASFWLWRSYSYGTDTITIEPELLLIESDYAEGLISKMRNIHKSTPPSFRRRENAAAIVKAPPPGALTKGSDRKFPGLHPPLGGATSPSLPTNRRFAFPILALLAALAVGLLFLLPGGLLQAQSSEMPGWNTPRTAPTRWLPIRALTRRAGRSTGRWLTVARGPDRLLWSTA